MPEDLPSALAAEIGPLLAELDALAAEGTRIRSEAERQRDLILESARVARAHLAAEAPGQVGTVRKAAAAERLEAARLSAAHERHLAAQRADEARAEARALSPKNTSRVVERIFAGVRQREVSGVGRLGRG